MADREDDGRSDQPAAADPGKHRVARLADLGEPAEQFSSAGATELVEHRVGRLADLGEAGPAVPVLSLQALEAEGEQAPVADLRSRRATSTAGGAAPSERPDPGLPPARVVQIRSDGRVRQGRSAPLSESARAAPADEPGPPGEAGMDASAHGSSAGGRPIRRTSGSDNRRATPGGRDRKSSAAERESEADPVAAAREICLRLLTERAHTREELAQALRKRGVPDDAAGTVLERFDEVGLIDDAAFAGQWVRSRHTRRGLARRAIAYELRRKGVDEEVAQEALAEVDANSEEQRARELVDHKLRTVPAGTPEQRTTAARRLVGMLARKGYSGGIAYRVVREALAAHGADIDELADGPVD